MFTRSRLANICTQIARCHIGKEQNRNDLGYRQEEETSEQLLESLDDKNVQRCTEQLSSVLIQT